MDFVATTLNAVCRREAADVQIKSKLRGRKLLLESARTVGLDTGDERPAKKRRAHKEEEQLRRDARLSRTSRAQRRCALLVAVREVTHEQLLQQHRQWTEYAREALEVARDAAHVSELVTQLDWHGAQLRVLHSQSPVHDCATGFMLAETERMLLLLNPTKRVWVPKAGARVEIMLPAGLRSGCATAQVDAGSHTPRT